VPQRWCCRSHDTLGCSQIIGAFGAWAAVSLTGVFAALVVLYDAYESSAPFLCERIQRVVSQLSFSKHWSLSGVSGALALPLACRRYADMAL